MKLTREQQHELLDICLDLGLNFEMAMIQGEDCYMIKHWSQKLSKHDLYITWFSSQLQSFNDIKLEIYTKATKL